MHDAKLSACICMSTCTLYDSSTTIASETAAETLETNSYLRDSQCDCVD